MTNPLVSVIIPNYNHAKYLKQRIDSILSQSYQNFELIILDDCSPDDGASRAVIEEYRNDPHVSYILYNDINSGSTFKQWDKGIKMAKGELVWIAESDDFCDSVLLEVLVREFERDNSLTLAYTLLQKVDAEGTPIPFICRTPCGVTRLNGHDYVRKYMTTCNHCANASAALFKKSAYENIERLYTTYKAGGDMLFWIEIAEKGNVAIVNKRLNFFRQHTHKVTQKSAKQGINSSEFKKTYDYISSHFNFSPKRRKLMVEHAIFRINKTMFDTDEIRKDLYEVWGHNGKLNTINCLKLKIIDILHHRLCFYP